MLALWWEVEIVLMFQSLGAWLDPIMLAASSLGFPLSYLVMIILYWCVDSRLGRRFSLFLLFTGALGAFLQLAIGGPRPYWVDSRIRLIGSHSTSYGMPSGHAMSSFGWLTIAQTFKKWWLWILMSTIVFMIGISRIYLGVHFLSQVLAGWLLSSAAYVLLQRYGDQVSQWMQAKSLPSQLIIITIGMLVYLFAGWLAARLTSGQSLPSDWLNNVQPYLDLNDVFDPSNFQRILGDSGAFFGCGGFWGGTFFFVPFSVGT